MSPNSKYVHYITVTLLNNSVDLSLNLDPEPLTEGIENFAIHAIF